MRELQENIIEKVRRCQDLEKLQAVDKILSSAASGRTLKRHIAYKGFGEEHTGPEWARRLGVPRKSMYRYLQRGMTIEQIAKMRGCSYPADNHANTTRKPRLGARMEETRQAMVKLLEDSGYPVDSGEAVDVIQHYGTRHIVLYNNEPVGQYNYKTGELHLGNGEGLRVRDPFVEKPMIMCGASGVWGMHPKTRQEHAARLIKKEDIPATQYPTW